MIIMPIEDSRDCKDESPLNMVEESHTDTIPYSAAMEKRSADGTCMLLPMTTRLYTVLQNSRSEPGFSNVISWRNDAKDGKDQSFASCKKELPCGTLLSKLIPIEALRGLHVNIHKSIIFFHHLSIIESEINTAFYAALF